MTDTDTLATSADPAPQDAGPGDAAAQDSGNAASAKTETATETAPATANDADAAKGGEAYRVLARKYRPTNFDELIGQEALVRTLTNAIQSGRIAHAFMLTGVRGIGKTTTARIIARALNCIGPDGTGGPTVKPCGECEHCKAIAADRHVDVMEMDAASRTGVDDIRELIDGVRYGPVSARYKIYIIDEVHMLSKAAFNALLKTLEEPPEHCKFVFATTEIRKVPVTVLSRCQRFDLKRVDADTLVKHFTNIAEQENARVDAEAIALIARAADGSVRDGLSLLDQAIALGGTEISEELVRDMLGMADRTRVLDLFEHCMTGKAPEALDILDDLHRGGADPLVVLQDLMELVHLLTKFRANPKTADSAALAEAERTRGKDLSEKLSIPSLTRAWQVLLKGIAEVQMAPAPQQAVEMVVIRLIHAAELPNPADLVRKLKDGGVTAATAAPAASTTPAPAPSASAPVASAAPSGSGGGTSGGGNSGGQAQAALAPQPETQPETMSVPATVPEGEFATVALANPESFPELVAMFGEQREGLLYGYLHNNAHLVKMERGRLELRFDDIVPKDIPARVGKCLSEWTGERWMVSIANAEGAPTLLEQEKAENAVMEEAVRAHPVMQGVLLHFPDAIIREIRNPLGATADDEAAMIAEAEAEAEDTPDDTQFETEKTGDI